MRGVQRKANTVDHIAAVKAGGDPFPPLSGLMSMCPGCHNAKTAAVDRKGGKSVRFPGCGLDGLPIDAAHPFFGGDTPSKDHGRGGMKRAGSQTRTKFTVFA
jgi:5-methylcytosine-specific restriction enzyme A